MLVDTRQRRTTAAVLASKRERFQAREPAMLTYVTETATLVDRLTTVLRQPQPDYREAGKVLTQAHALLRDQVACSTPLIEECISRVLNRREELSIPVDDENSGSGGRLATGRG